jgi:general secretion pathway protein A
MQYYKLLQLDREPFSNSPDPDFFFNSYQHRKCLQKLELALRLKRGLNVVIGDVGTGKTTLCRQLIRKLTAESDIETHLVLDPSFNTPVEFLRNIAEFICNRPPDNDLTELDLKEQIKRYLFLKGVDQGKTIVLIIDEGQKISQPSVEILRELLNYETNNFKLLQIIIFAQLEFKNILSKHANFADRINLLHHLAPLNFSDTRNLIYHRLKLSSTTAKPKNIFTLPALWTIYRASRGYPRKIINICHQSILALIIQNRTQAGWALIRSCKNRLYRTTQTERLIFAAIIIVLVSAAALNIFALMVARPKPEVQISKPYKIAPVNQQPEPFSSISTSDNRLDDSKSLPLAGLSNSETSDMDQENKPIVAAMIDQNSMPDERNDAPSDTAITASHPPLSAPPVLLGQLIVRPGDTLGTMVHNVYGTYRKRILAELIHANAHIRNPDNIDVGNIVLFPAMDFEVDALNKPFIIIVFDERQSLVTAMQRVTGLYKEMQLPVRPFPTWSPTDGLRFHLVLRGYFDSHEAASRYLSLLPTRFSDQASIISEWPDSTMLFSDPYGGGLRLSPLTVRTEIEKQKKTW